MTKVLMISYWARHNFITSIPSSYRRSSFLIKRFDKSALLDALHDRRVDDQVRIGLLRFRILVGQNLQRSLGDFQRGCRILFGHALRVLIGFFEDFVAGSSHVFLHDRETLLSVSLGNISSLDHGLQNLLG